MTHCLRNIVLLSFMVLCVSSCNFETCKAEPDTVQGVNIDSINQNAPYSIEHLYLSSDDQGTPAMKIKVGNQFRDLKPFSHTHDEGAKFEFKIKEPIKVEQRQIILGHNVTMKETPLTDIDFENRFLGWSFANRYEFLVRDDSGIRLIKILDDGSLVSTNQNYETRWIENTGLRYSSGNSKDELFKVYNADDVIEYTIGALTEGTRVSFFKKQSDIVIVDLGSIDLPESLGATPYVDFYSQQTSPDAKEMWVPVLLQGEIKSYLHANLETGIHKVLPSTAKRPFPENGTIQMNSYDGLYSVKEDVISHSWVGTVNIQSIGRGPSSKWSDPLVSGDQYLTEARPFTVYSYDIKLVAGSDKITQRGTFNIQDSYEYCYRED